MRYATLLSNLYNALVRCKLEYNALVWHLPEKCYILMVEKVQKAFLRSLFYKEYGYYPFMFRTELFLDMIGYNSLLLRINLALLPFVFQLMRGEILRSTLLDHIGLNVPMNFLRGRHHEYLAVAASPTPISIGRTHSRRRSVI
jgi:hypothetical protein